MLSHFLHRQEHKCMVAPSYSPFTEHLLQLSGPKLAKFLEGIEYNSPRQKVPAIAPDQ